jgi:hypothetical protein
MKKILLPLFACLALMMSSCSKDDDVSTSKSSGSSTPTSSKDFVELKIANTPHSIHETQSATQYARGLAEIGHSALGDSYIITFMNVTCPDNLLSFSMILPFNKVSGLGQYTFNARFLDVQASDKQNNVYLSDQNSIININITSLNSAIGGKIEGTFTISNLKMTNGTTNASVNGIDFTGGKFSATFE